MPKETSPNTSNFVDGAVVPIPTLPFKIVLPVPLGEIVTFWFVPPAAIVKALLPVIEPVVVPVPPFAIGSVPVTPVVKGNPVALVKVTEDGVPKTGATKVGLVANTARPVPVSSDNAPARPAEFVSVFCLPVTAAPAAASA